MKQVILILRILSGITMIAWLSLFLLGYNDVAIYFIWAAMLCTSLAIGIGLSRSYHHYFLNRRRRP